MLSRERYEVWVGLVFVASLALLVIGVIWAKRIAPASAGMAIEVAFGNVGGLREGDGVLVSGVHMGNVEAIELRSTDVLVTAMLDRPVRLTDESRIGIVITNLTGEMGLSVEPGHGTPREPPIGILRGETPIQIADLLAPTMETVASIRAAADTLALAMPLIVRRASSAMDHLDTALTAMDAGIRDGRTELIRTLVEMRATGRSARETLASLDTRMATGVDAAKEMFSSIASASDTLRMIAGALDTTHGTLGRLIYGRELHDELRRAAAHLDSASVSIDSLVTDIRNDPDKYIHFSLF